MEKGRKGDDEPDESDAMNETKRARERLSTWRDVSTMARPRRWQSRSGGFLSLKVCKKERCEVAWPKYGAGFRLALDLDESRKR